MRGTTGSLSRDSVLLFLASCLALYFELVIIRYLSSEIRVFAYLKNLALIASFFGIGLGMILGKPPAGLKRVFPLIVSILFLIIAFASPLRLTHLVFPNDDRDYVMWGEIASLHSVPWYLQQSLLTLMFLVIVPGIMYLLVAFFVVFGGIVGERLTRLSPLLGYGINLAGSLAGILGFTLLSFLRLPPSVWLLVGFLASLPFFIRDRRTILAFATIVIAVAFAHPRTYWSPYYRIDLKELAGPEGRNGLTAYLLSVNHDYHQMILDLSNQSVDRFPQAKPTRAAYDLPYRVVSGPKQVLVVGAGTGNDVAAALRNGAFHVDAVEIDPVILDLGRKYHPERPYDSDRVTVFLDDARAYFHKCRRKYDLIVFGFLDSHTLLTSMSSVRLDNYVYTLESFREAKALLAKDGALYLGFSSGRSFLGDRIFATLSTAFGSTAHAYFIDNEQSGVAYIEGGNVNSAVIADFPEVSGEFQSHMSAITLATDRWPFLYLRSRSIPLMILIVVALFLYVATGVLKRRVPLGGLRDPQNFHLFFLGSGFMLLETKGVTELSLLFGSTWIVNAVVISAFLLMGMLANAVVAKWPVPRHWAYTGLFVALIAGMVVPYSSLAALANIEKVLAATLLVGLPVFFSGMVFSRSFAEVAEPSRSLGINLLGAVVGGVLENLVMIGGTPILGVLAVTLYGVSAIGLGGTSLGSLIFSTRATRLQAAETTTEI